MKKINATFYFIWVLIVMTGFFCHKIEQDEVVITLLITICCQNLTSEISKEE